MAKKRAKQSKAMPHTRKHKPVRRRRKLMDAKRFPLFKGIEEPRESKYVDNGKGIKKFQPETFPPGTAMSENGFPVFSLALRQLHPATCVSIDRQLRRAADIEAKRVAYQARMDRRPLEMRRCDYRMPPDVLAFLQRRYSNDAESAADGKVMEALGYDTDSDLYRVLVDVIRDATRHSYDAGCTEGYIEGKVADIEPKRERSRKANAARRQKHNLDERDAEIVEKHRRLRAVPLSASETEFRLAEEYGLSDKMIRIIIGKARKSGR